MFPRSASPACPPTRSLSSFRALTQNLSGAPAAALRTDGKRPSAPRWAPSLGNRSSALPSSEPWKECCCTLRKTCSHQSSALTLPRAIPSALFLSPAATTREDRGFLNRREPHAGEEGRHERRRHVRRACLERALRQERVRHRARIRPGLLSAGGVWGWGFVLRGEVGVKSGAFGSSFAL